MGATPGWPAASRALSSRWPAQWADRLHNQELPRPALNEGECHIDSGRLFVAIFDLRFGQRGTAIQTPVHRLETLQMAAIDDLGQSPDDVGLERKIHRQVRLDQPQIPPCAQNQLLRLDLLTRVFTTVLPNSPAVTLWPGLPTFFSTFSPIVARAVPTRHVGRAEPGKRFRFDNDVLRILLIACPTWSSPLA